MTTRIFVDRSRYESAQRCQRARWYGYHQNGVGIQSQRQPLPLAVGGSVHKGLATLLELGGSDWNKDNPTRWELAESQAVATALTDFAQYQHALDAPDAESATIATALASGQYFDAASPEDARNAAEVNKELYLQRRNEFDEYLFREQSALVEAMVRAYARRRLRPLLEQFEVLEVEREGEWLLSEGITLGGMMSTPTQMTPELWFMSRPDALLRDRESNQLYLLSYKTTGSWDIRKARDAEHDMQGMSEGIEIERRLAEWWMMIQAAPKPWSLNAGFVLDTGEVIPAPMADYLRHLDAPPRILAVRMEYLLKSERWIDKDLSAQLGCEMRSQRSPLIRQYVAVSVPMRGVAGYNIGDVNCSWDYIRDDGRESTLAWQNWKSRPVWEEPGGVKAWIDQLDSAAPMMSGEDSTMGLEPRQLGYQCDAQVTGYLKQHPLDAVFVPPLTTYRNEDELRDMVDQMESQERRIAEGIVAVNAASDSGERHHQLNVNFPQTRRACFYPTQCSFVPICFGSDEVRRDPIASGLFKIRRANHPQENNADAIKDA